MKNSNQLSYVSQTTLSVDDTAKIIDVLRQRYPSIAGPRKDDICYATQNRQDAVKYLAQHCDIVFVVGSVNSSNSNRLRELAERMQCKAYLIDGPNDISGVWLLDAKNVGVTAGASAPEILVQQVVTQLQTWGGTVVEELAGREETIVFALPKALRRESETETETDQA